MCVGNDKGVALKKKIKKILGQRIGYHEPDNALIIVVGVILLFGLISLSSASAIIAYSNFGDVYYYFKHQLVGLGFGLVAFIFFSRVDYHVWSK